MLMRAETLRLFSCGTRKAAFLASHLPRDAIAVVPVARIELALTHPLGVRPLPFGLDRQKPAPILLRRFIRPKGDTGTGTG